MRKILVALVLVSCSSHGPGTSSSPQDRSPPLVPESLAQLMADGATCVDGPPSICTTTDPACVLTYDANGLLSHMRCEVLDVVFECTRPCGTDFVCRWSDEPSCADVYTADGGFVGYFCDAALAAQVPCTTPPPPTRCAQLDEMSCRASAACKPEYCVAADGTESYGGCYGPNDAGPMCMINPPPPDACRGQDEQTCLTIPDCKPEYCFSAAGIQSYDGCYGATDVVPVCMSTPPIPDDVCRQFDEMACATNSACTAAYCPDADGNKVYLGCYGHNSDVPACR